MNTHTLKTETNLKTMNDWEKMRHFPKAVYVLFIGTFINRFGTFVLPYMALYLTHKGYTLTQAGNALAAWGLGNLMATIIGGHLADTFGRRNTIVLSMAGSAIMMVLLSQADTLLLFVILAFFAALFTEIYRPACHALVADLVDAEERILVYAVLRWAVNAGFAFGPALAGLLTRISFVWIFWFDAATSVVFGLLALFFLPQFNKHMEVSISHVFRAFSSLKKAFGTTLTDLRFVQIFIASFLIAFAFLQTFSTLGIEVKQRGFDEMYFGFILGINGFMIVFFELSISMWIRRKPQRLMMAIGFALIGLGFGIFAFGDGLYTLCGGMVVMTVGEMIAMPVSLTYVSTMAPEDMRGRYMGVWGFSWALAMVIATSGGLVFYAIMGSEFWILVAGFALLASVLILINPLKIIAGYESSRFAKSLKWREL
jgi:MFS family permease